MATGKEIKRLRGSLSAQDAADLIGVDAQRLRKWEQRDSDPKDSGDIKAVEDYFGVPLSRLSTLDSFQFIPKVPVAEEPESTYKDKYITALEKIVEKQEALLLEVRASLKTQSDRLTEVEKVLSEVKNGLMVVHSVQYAFQRYWVEHFHPEKDSQEAAYEKIAQEAFASLREFQKGGIRILQGS